MSKLKYLVLWITIIGLTVGMGLTFLFPLWPRYLESRPLFYYWVSARRVGWGPYPVVSDKAGTWAFHDKILNLTVCVVTNEPEDNLPVPICTSEQAIFRVNDRTVIVRRVRDTLVIIRENGDSEFFAVTPPVGNQVWHAVLERGNNSIKKEIVRSYKGKDGNRLLEFLNEK